MKNHREAKSGQIAGSSKGAAKKRPTSVKHAGSLRGGDAWEVVSDGQRTLYMTTPTSAAAIHGIVKTHSAALKRLAKK